MTIIVPAYLVNITGVPDYPLYAGTRLFLTCVFELPVFVDSAVALNSVWKKGGEVITSDDRVNVSTSDRDTSAYLTTLSISPLSSTVDGGQYTCQSSIAANSYVFYSDSFYQISVRIEGKTIHFFKICTFFRLDLPSPLPSCILSFFHSDLPVPAISISTEDDLTAGENGTLTCTATVIEGLTDDAQIATSWLDSKGEMVKSSVVEIFEVHAMATLKFEPLLLSHGGRYSCNASITIPATSTVKQNSKSYDLIVKSKSSISPFGS